MKPPRDHHFIPAFYLRQWSVLDGKLVEYTLKNGRLIAKCVGPRATGFQTDLYAFPELPPDLAQYLEAMFFDYADRMASNALALHLHGPPNGRNPELLSAWSRFVIGIHLRHPDAIAELRAAVEAIWEEVSGHMQRDYMAQRQPDDPMTYDEYLSQRDPFTAAKARLNLIMKAIDNELIGTRVNQMTWATVDVSASPIRLLTSDRPVEMYLMKERDGILALPISPTKLFVAVNTQTMLDKFGASKPLDIARQVNKRVVRCARRFVWASDKSQSQFIQSNMSIAMEPTPLLPSLGRYKKA